MRYVKKILVLIIVLIFVKSISFAQDTVQLEKESLIPKILDGANTLLFEGGADYNEVVDETLIESTIHHHSKFYDELYRTAHNVYNLQIENTKVPSCLLKEPLTHNFENGPLESVHLWSVVQMKMNTDFVDNDVDNTFRVGLVNALIDGKLRGGKEDFRIMLDPTPQNDRPYMQNFFKDLYIETHRIPNHTLLIGHSRPTVGIEGGQSPYTLPLASRAQISRHFGNARKLGVRLRGDYSFLDYDLGAYSSGTYFNDFFPGQEFDGWVNFKPLAKCNEKYGKLSTGGGIATGQRDSKNFTTVGAHLGYEYKKMWFRAEYATANGSNGGSGLTRKNRQGYYLTLGYHINKKLEAIVRYDKFDPDKHISHNNQKEYTFGMNYYLKGQALKLILNYVFCQNDSKKDSHRIIVGTQIAI